MKQKKQFLYFISFSLCVYYLLLPTKILADCSDPYIGPDFYVDTDSGSDTNNGTLLCPFKTVQKGIDEAVADSIISIRAGVYNEIVLIDESSPTGALTVQAFPGDEEGVLIDGSGISDPQGVFKIINPQASVTIHGISITGDPDSGTSNCLFARWADGMSLTNVGVSNCDRNGFYIRDSSNVLVQGALVEHIQSSGISFDSPEKSCSNITISENYISDVFNAGVNVRDCDGIYVRDNILREVRTSPYGDEGISLGSVSNFEISGNDVMCANSDLYVIAIDVKHSDSHDGTIHDNYVHRHNGAGIYLDAWRKIEGKSLHNIEVFNNTIVATSSGIMISTEGCLVEPSGDLCQVDPTNPRCESCLDDTDNDNHLCHSPCPHLGGDIENIKIYGNVISHAKSSGFVIHNHSLLPVPKGDGFKKNIYFFNNTIERSRKRFPEDGDGYTNGGAGITVMSNNIENIVIRNNIINFGPPYYEVEAAAPEVLKWHGQIILHDSVDPVKISDSRNIISNATYSLPDYFEYAANGIYMEAEDIDAFFPDPEIYIDPDPALPDLDDLTIDLTPHAFTNFIDSGSEFTGDELPVDADTTFRPWGNNINIGAIEHHQGL